MKTYDVALPKAKRGLGDIDYRRRLAQQLMSQGTDTSPVGHWTQAAARIAQAISGSLNQDQAESQDAALQADANAALMQMLPSMTGGSSSAGAPPQSAIAAASQPVQPLSDEELGVAKFASPGLAQSVPKVAAAMAPQNMRGAPAAIRHNNPGAMWPGPSSKKFGATGFQVIGGGNKIATFPDATSGAAAQFDLLNRSYAGMPLNAAIRKWSGGNSSPQYVAKIAQSLGVAPNTVLTPQMLQDPAVAVPLAKTMAQWESGKPFPLDDQKWNEAHKMALGGPTQAETAAAQPQQMQVADASGTPDRATIERLLSNPYTRDMALKLIQQQSMPKDKPMNVQEWEYFQKLPPDKQEQYIRMKRSEKFLDLGTKYRNPTTGEDYDKDIAGKQRQEEIGTAQGKQIAAAPGDIAAADEALALIDSLRVDPNREWGTGMSSALNFIPGTPGKSFQLKVNQARSGAFLTAIQQLRGMGALSNAEGQTATDAVTRLTTADTEDGFLKALSDYEKVVRAGRDRASGRLQPQSSSPSRPDIKSKYRDLE